jgi:hypothetical protein
VLLPVAGEEESLADGFVDVGVDGALVVGDEPGAVLELNEDRLDAGVEVPLLGSGLDRSNGESTVALEGPIPE